MLHFLHTQPPDRSSPIPQSPSHGSHDEYTAAKEFYRRCLKRCISLPMHLHPFRHVYVFSSSLPSTALKHSKPFLYFHFVLIQNTFFPIIYYELFISFNENENKPSWIYLFHNGFFHFSCQKLNCAETAKVLGAPRPILLPPAAYQ